MVFITELEWKKKQEKKNINK